MGSVLAKSSCAVDFCDLLSVIPISCDLKHGRSKHEVEGSADPKGTRITAFLTLILLAILFHHFVCPVPLAFLGHMNHPTNTASHFIRSLPRILNSDTKV